MSLPLQLSSVYADDWGEDSGWSIDIVDLAINWHKYRGQMVLINDVLYCVDVVYCVFRRPEVHFISVDIQELPTSAQKQMVIDCHDGCSLKLVGKVESDRLVASRFRIE